MVNSGYNFQNGAEKTNVIFCGERFTVLERFSVNKCNLISRNLFSNNISKKNLLFP